MNVNEGDRLIELTYIHNRLKDIFEDGGLGQKMSLIALGHDIQDMVNGNWTLPPGIVLTVMAQEDEGKTVNQKENES